MLARVLRRTTAGHLDKWWGVATVGLNSLFRLVFSVAIARAGGPDVFAVFVGLTTAEIVANSVLSSAVVTPMVSIAPAVHGDRRASFLRLCLRRNHRAAALLALVSMMAAPLATRLGVDAAVHAAFCAYLFVWLAGNGTGGALAAGFRNSRAAAADVLGYSIQLGGTSIAWYTGAPLLLMFFSAGVVGHGLAWWWMEAAIPRAAAGADGGVVARARVLGRDIAIGSIANSLCSRTQPFVLAWSGGPHSVSAFGAAQTFVGPVRTLATALGEVLRPRLAVYSRRPGGELEAERSLRRCLVVVGGIAIAMFAIAAVLAEPLTGFVFGSAFVAVADVLPWAALFAGAASIVSILVVAMQLRSSRGAFAASRLRIGAAVLSLLAVFPACALDGARGAYAAMAATEVLFALAAVRYLRRPAGPEVESVPGVPCASRDA